MKSLRQFLPVLAILTANLIYAVNFIVAKGVMPDFLSPKVFISLRLLFATAFFLVIVALFKKPNVEKSDLLRLALCGLFGTAANQYLFFEGLNLTSPINASIIMVSTPLLVLVLGLVTGMEKRSKTKIVALLLGGVGAAVMMVFAESNMSLGVSNPVLGNFFVFLNALFYGIYLLLAKPMMEKYGPITVLRWCFTFGSLFLLPFFANEFTVVDWASFPSYIWWSIGFVLLFTTCFTYLLNGYGLSRVPASVVGFFIYAQPLFAGILSILLGKDTLSWNMILGALLIGLGVFLLLSERSRVLKPSV